MAMRKVIRGPDGFKTEDGQEPTEEEIQAWYDMFCDYCGSGYLASKKAKTTQEICDSYVPCPVCQATGRKDHSKYYQYIQDVSVKVTDKIVLDPESYCPKRKVIVEFNLAYEGQPSNRPLGKSTLRMIKAYHLGFKVIDAMEDALEKLK